ncbi:short-chain dehydrogenase reductase SDR [Loigolactobacillus bifermentans DSM 20003]|uniref:Short-chain dehydrogenase reductase SDR n=2 Tax=Loigolactobacillus bifermentans TaxID=1607 RepID=A0A0R1H2A5_9LACO|nr:short-chain dehydrogenase reductase SDR [Loigolactobacillus bifermentans DSM 20003]
MKGERNMTQHFDQRTTAAQVMQGIQRPQQVAVVTGGYSGVGLQVTKALIKADMQVIVPARRPAVAQQIMQQLPQVIVLPCDLMVARSINDFADQVLQRFRRIDLFIGCAGIMFAPLRRDAAGNESQFSVNYLGHFRLLKRLYPALRAGHARVVLATSRAQSWNGVDFEDPNFQRRPYDPKVAYAQSKTADILLAVELDRLAQKDGVRAFAVHPGLIPGTNLGRFMQHSARLRKLSAWLLNHGGTTVINGRHRFQAWRHNRSEYDYFKTPAQGAASILWAATSPTLAQHGGVFIEDCHVGQVVTAESTSKYGVRPWAVDQDLARQLWQLGEQLNQFQFKIPSSQTH